LLSHDPNRQIFRNVRSEVALKTRQLDLVPLTGRPSRIQDLLRHTWVITYDQYRQRPGSRLYQKIAAASRQDTNTEHATLVASRRYRASRARE